jgi:hypothetical protein
MPNEMLPDSATLYNYIGEDADGNALYIRTCFTQCRVVLTTGSRLENEDDNITVLLFDAFTLATNGATVKSYCDPRAFETLTDKNAHWTLRDDGKDWITKGARTDDQPPADGTAFAIRTTKRNQMGSYDLWHWKVTGR